MGLATATSFVSLATGMAYAIPRVLFLIYFRPTAIQVCTNHSR
jgi:hypothetical protein